MQKKQLPVWARCLLLIALTLVGSGRFWLPITADSGNRSTRILMNAYANSQSITLDFGTSDNFRLPRTGRSEALLEAGAIGQEYIITSVYHHKRGSGDFNEIYSLYGADGTVYRTIEESEAARQAQLPGRLALFAALDAVGCVILCLGDRFLRKRDTAPPEEVSQ